MEPDEFSQEALEALNQKTSFPSVVDLKPRNKTRQVEPFLRGPVPMSWLMEAFKVAGGGGLMLGLKLWWVSGMTGSKTFSINVTRVETGQSQRNKWRMLKMLECAGLLRKATQPGKRLQIELLVKKQTNRDPP